MIVAHSEKGAILHGSKIAVISFILIRMAIDAKNHHKAILFYNIPSLGKKLKTNC